MSKIVDIVKLSFGYSFCLSAMHLMTAFVATMLFPEKSLSFVLCLEVLSKALQCSMLRPHNGANSTQPRGLGIDDFKILKISNISKKK